MQGHDRYYLVLGDCETICGDVYPREFGRSVIAPETPKSQSSIRLPFSPAWAPCFLAGAVFELRRYFVAPRHREVPRRTSRLGQRHWTESRERCKRKCALTSTGLLMEGVALQLRSRQSCC